MVEAVHSLKEDVSIPETQVGKTLPKPNASDVPSDNGKASLNKSHAPHNNISKNSFKERAKRKFSLAVSRHDLEAPSHSSRASDGNESQSLKVEQSLLNDPAFNPARIVSQKPPSLSEDNESTLKDSVKAVATIVAHPKEAIRSKATRTAAEKISRAQRPVISPAQDRHFLELHENLSRSHSGFNEAPNEQEQHLRAELNQAEDQRASLKTAWTIGRQVDRVRVVQNIYSKFPDKSAFEERDEDNKLVRVKWEKYIGYIALYYTRGFTAQYIDDFDTPAYNLDALALTVERLAMASAPLQAWWVSSRQLYRWEDPWRTSRWFAIFIYLWYTDHIVSFFYAYVIYIVVKERIFPSSVNSVRESLDRATNQSARAQAWGDLVEKHGRGGWVDPLLEDVGPQVLLQLGDLADYFEVLQNFYKWTAPTKTAATLFFFFCCLLVTLLSDMRYCMKIVWFIVGFAFFLCWPLSSYYPRYRRLLDPFSWIIWDIPTNAEQSLKYLQLKAEDHQKLIDMREAETSGATKVNSFSSRHKSITKMLRNAGQASLSGTRQESLTEMPVDDKYSTPPSSQDSSPSRKSSSTRYKFKAKEKSTSGKVVVDRQGISFFSHSTVPAWRIPYGSLVEMNKGLKSRQNAKLLQPALERLELCYRDDQGLEAKKHIDTGRGERDEIFNLAIGLSGLRWRSMMLDHALREKGGD